MAASAPSHSAAEHRAVESAATVLESAFVVLALVFFTDAIRVLVQNPSGEGTVSLGRDVISLPGMMFIYSATAALLVLRWTRLRVALPRMYSLLPVLAIAPASILWSSDFSVTAKHAIWMIGSTAFGMYLHLRFSERTQLALLSATLACVVVLSYAFATLTPDLGVDPGLHGGAWRGVFIHKNSLGRIATLSVFLFALGAMRGSRGAALYAMAALVSGVLLVLSRSASAALVLVMGAPVAVVAVLLQRKFIGRRAAQVFLISATTLGAVAFGVFGSELLALLGKDATLTGRSTLWAAVTIEALEKPFLGFGYHAFWNGSSAPYLDIWRLVQWAPPHAHNGFLDTWLQFGLVGLGVFLATYLYLLRCALRHGSSSRASWSAAWPLVYLTYYALSNIAESTFFRHTSIFWIIFVACACNLVNPSGGRASNAGAAREPKLKGRLAKLFSASSP